MCVCVSVCVSEEANDMILFSLYLQDKHVLLNLCSLISVCKHRESLIAFRVMSFSQLPLFSSSLQFESDVGLECGSWHYYINQTQNQITYYNVFASFLHYCHYDKFYQ